MTKRILLPTLALIALLLSACEPANLAEHDGHIAHPLTAEKRMALAVLDGPELTAFDQTRVKRLAAESLRRSAGGIEIIIQAKSGEEEISKIFAHQLVSLFKHEGVNDVQASVQVGDNGDGSAVIQVPVWEAVVPTCGNFERGLNPDHDNAPHSNWGCSIQRNTALMLQNPADLIRARESTGRDANRAADVLDKYGRGEATGSAKESRSTGSTSDVGNSSGAGK